jgi:hypothetical protein
MLSSQHNSFCPQSVTCAGYMGYPFYKNALMMTTTQVFSYLST